MTRIQNRVELVASAVRAEDRVRRALALGENAGRGGRNQELLLGAGHTLNDELIASLGTDGIDGASDAAGGLLDRALLTRTNELGLDCDAALTQHDAGTLLSRVGGAILTGKTGTNVADVCLVVP